jgi:hypothetical protein
LSAVSSRRRGRSPSPSCMRDERPDSWRLPKPTPSSGRRTGAHVGRSPFHCGPACSFRPGVLCVKNVLRDASRRTLRSSP